MQQVLKPSRRLEGVVRLPGDKSISHRYALLASIAEGRSVLDNYSSGADCHSTLACLRALGVPVEVSGRAVAIEGRGLHGFVPPAAELDAGNSGSTIRMLSGLLAGAPFTSRLAGDESLSRRPMQRIMTPLAQMGAKLSARDGKYPPLTIAGLAPLRAIDYASPVASAQVKSCVLLAGLMADGKTTVREPAPTRDHTEVALRELGVDVERGKGWVSVTPPARIQARDLAIPGDLSSAAFFLVAAAIRPGSRLILREVGLNPTRASLIEFLTGAGAEIEVLELNMRHGEPVGDLLVRGGALKGGVIEGALAAALIDEIPVLSVLGAVSEDGLTVRDAAELRVKETDRIEAVAANLRALGVEVETAADGMRIPGRQSFQGGAVDSRGDHRIAMALAVAALAAQGEVAVHGAEAASVSFPEFWDTLASVVE